MMKIFTKLFSVVLVLIFIKLTVQMACPIGDGPPVWGCEPIEKRMDVQQPITTEQPITSEQPRISEKSELQV